MKATDTDTGEQVGRIFAVDDFKQDEAVITVTCTKGTYIRTLAEDIGKQLGCGAHLIGLRRTATANYKIVQTITLEQLEAMTLEQREAALLSEDSAVQHLPVITLDDDSVFYLQQGQGVWKSGTVPKGLLRLYSEQRDFLGLGELSSDGKIAPKRLIRHTEN